MVIIKRKAVFLDRDGVLIQPIIQNNLPYSAKTIKEINFIQGVKETINEFKKLDYLPVVITNQPEVARGTLQINNLNSMNSYIMQYLKIENLYVCIHDELDGCDCRKPNPGMLLRASNELQINLKESILVGDRWKDIECGQNVGCKCYFINYGYNEKHPQKPYTIIKSLGEILEFIGGANELKN